MTLLQRKILILDDSPEDRAMFRRYLQHAPHVDYAVWEEELGEAGFVTCGTIHPDCILLDYKLPDLDGLELLRRLRAEDGTLPYAVILLTAKGDEGRAVEAMKRGAHDYLVKGKMTRQGLRRAVAGAIEKADLERTVSAQRRALAESNQKLQRAVHALRQAQDESEQRVQDRTTELTRANKALQTQAQVLEGMVEGVLVATKDGAILFTNRAFDTMFGYERGELLGQQALVLTAGPPDESTQAAAQILQHVQTHGAWRGEIQSCKKDRTAFPTYARISVVELEKEKYLVSILEDITERKQLEAALYERERLVTIGTTAINLTHEIGNRLNSVSTSVQLLERHLNKQEVPPNGPVEEIVRDLQAEIHRLRSVLQDIRILTNVHKLNCQPTNIAAVVAEVLESQVHSFAQHGIHVEQQFPANLPLAIADWEKLSQIVLNLCTNAVEAMPQGGTLTLSGSKAESQVRLDVQDTGEGIPEGVKTFDPFTTTKPGGTGLGLAITHQLVAAHNGRITYTSTPKQGTTFTLTLPAALEETRDSNPPHATSLTLKPAQQQSDQADRQNRTASG